MTEKQRKIEKYLENSKTVSGSLDLSSYIEDSQVEGFLENLDCDVEIELRETIDNEACPSCLSLSLIKEGRCTTCLDCGYSLCSL